jgi:hypothetical protein
MANHPCSGNLLFVYDHMMLVPNFLLMILFALSLSSDPSLSDSDGDGLTDKFEQELLATFVPKFMLSAKECDGLPAEFRQGIPKPQLLAKNGIIYGQVFPITLSGKPGIHVEIHYYHLWNRDCGLNGHELDAEHVSGLIWAPTTAEPLVFWKARYWYAAAHEETVCDASHAVQSSFINAEQAGPIIWISAGKHASFLDQELCRGGCGVDSCNTMEPMAISGIVNLGERNAPMNGASWIKWQGWPLAAKMQTDFPEPVLTKLEAADPSVIVSINESQSPVKTTILVGSATASALIGADQKTDEAFSAASGALGASTEKSTRHTGNALKRAAQSVWKALRGAGNKSE